MYMPILEMAHTRQLYIPEICYLYNSNTGMNNHIVKKQEQLDNEKKIKAKTPYKIIE
jgi:hypothetical protein